METLNFSQINQEVLLKVEERNGDFNFERIMCSANTDAEVAYIKQRLLEDYNGERVLPIRITLEHNRIC